MDQTVDALIGAGYGSAGERCMAISVAVPVGKTTADRLMEKLIPRVESLEDRHLDRSESADFGPLVTKAALEHVKDYVEVGIKEGATLAVDGRGFKMQGYENGFYMGGVCSTMSPRTCASTRKRSSARCCRWCAPTTTTRRWRCRRPRLRQRRCDLHPRRRRSARLRREGQGRHGRHQRAVSRCRWLTTLSAAGSVRASATSTSMVPDSVRFYTKTKTVTSRWPSGRQGRRGVRRRDRRPAITAILRTSARDECNSL